MFRWLKTYFEELGLGLIFITVGGLGILTTVPNQAGGVAECTQRWANSGLETSFNSSGVCLVQIRPDVWVPESAVKTPIIQHYQNDQYQK